MSELPSSGSVSTRLLRIAELARRSPGTAFTSLAHNIDIYFLGEAFRRTRKDGATGIDGQTAEEYEVGLTGRLTALLDRFKSGSYFAPPVRRVHIPKGDGTAMRPIGIPTFEDKVLQRAVAMVLEAVYEQGFPDCSFGFRPNRSADQALEVLWNGMMKMHGGWVLEVDIRSFFDTLNHGHLRSFLDQRVCDGVLRRMIDKWLKAGILEDGAVSHPETGTPQGGVISPLLANVYLHEVLDKWFENVVKPQLRGQAFLVRYADDFVIVFSLETDARQVEKMLPERFGQYGLTLHPEKTRLFPFRRPSLTAKRSSVESFDFLGFTHYWTRSRNGFWVIKRRTSKGRLRRALQRVSEWCREHRHDPVRVQHRVLVAKFLGHFNYYGITGNWEMLDQFRYEVKRIWKTWLSRRSQKGFLTWGRLKRLLRSYPLPMSVAVHSTFRPQRTLVPKSRMR